MIIGIDGNEANVKNRVGVNTYAFEILKNLHKLQEEGSGSHNLIVYLKETPLTDMPKEMQNFKYKVIPGGSLWIVKKLMPHLIKNPDGVDVLFSPSHYTVPFSKVPRVCSIMDLGYLEFSEQFTKKVFWQLKFWTAISIFASKRVISISESTKDEIVRHYPFARGKVYVTHLGFDADVYSKEVASSDVRRIKNKYSIVDDYVVYVGTLKPSKNLEGLIRAFSRIAGEFPTLKLVVAGKKGWLYDTVFALVGELGMGSRVVFTDFIDEKDKPALIAGAKAFCLPSFWEGFGLDLLSAMSLGTPVVAGRVGSIPEVVGGAGILVDPYNAASIAQGIKKVLRMSEMEYNNLKDAGKRRAGKFSWEKCAEETLAIVVGAK